MKSLFITLMLIPFFGVSQTNFNKIELNTKEEIKLAEPAIIEASELILSTPTKSMTQRSVYAQLFIIQWMEKTEYVFLLSPAMLKCAKKDELFGIYLAALAKGRLAFESKFQEHTVQEFIKYLSNPKMNIKHTGAIKKLIKANKNGDISAYLA